MVSALKRPAIGLVGLLAALMLLPAALVSAAPANPVILINETDPSLALVDQNGIYDPANGKFASGWFDVALTNPGTSAYTQITLTVEPEDDTLDLVARYAHSGAAGAPTPIPAATSTDVWPSSCVKYAKDGTLQTSDEAGWTFVCSWTANLQGGATTPPIRFVYGAPTLPLSDVTFAITASIKSLSTSGSGGSGTFDDATTLAYLNASFKESADAETTYRFGTTPQTTIETYKEGKREGSSTSVVLPASSNGYSAALQDLGTSVASGCGAVYDSIDSTVPNPDAQITKITVNGGAIVSPYLKVTIKATWPASSPQPAKGAIDDARVYWCKDDGTWASIGKTAPSYTPGVDGFYWHYGTQCVLPKRGDVTLVDGLDGDTEADPCWVSATQKTTGKGTTTWTLVALLPHNGLSKAR